MPHHRSIPVDLPSHEPSFELRFEVRQARKGHLKIRYLKNLPSDTSKNCTQRSPKTPRNLWFLSSLQYTNFAGHTATKADYMQTEQALLNTWRARKTSCMLSVKSPNETKRFSPHLLVVSSQAGLVDVQSTAEGGFKVSVRGICDVGVVKWVKES